MSIAGATTVLAAALVAAGPHAGVAPHDPPPGSGRLEVIRLTETPGGRDVTREGDPVGSYFGSTSRVADQSGDQAGRLDACVAEIDGNDQLGILKVATLNLPDGQVYAQDPEQTGVRSVNGVAAITAERASTKESKGNSTSESTVNVWSYWSD